MRIDSGSIGILLLIEEASGPLGKIGIYSINGNKIITTSGGGMLEADFGHFNRWLGCYLINPENIQLP